MSPSAVHHQQHQHPGWPPEIQAVLGRARQYQTPCGPGHMVWHTWGHGEPVVLLHGGSGSWLHWLRNIDALVAAGRSVWVPDMPGFGDSARPVADPHAGHDADAIVAPLAAGWAELLGPQPVDVIAFSFGTLVSVLLTAAHAARVRRLLLLGAPILPLLDRKGVGLRAWGAHADQAERLAVHRHNLGALMLHRPDAIDDTAVAIQAANIPRDRMRRRRLVTTSAFGDALQQVRCPLDVLYGAEDVLYREHWPLVTTAWRAHATLGDLQVLPGVGHWLQYEAPDAVNTWLVQRLGDGAAR